MLKKMSINCRETIKCNRNCIVIPTNNQSVLQSYSRFCSNHHWALHLTKGAFKRTRALTAELTFSLTVHAFHTSAAILTGSRRTKAGQAHKLPPNVSTPFRGNARVGRTYGFCNAAFADTYGQKRFVCERVIFEEVNVVSHSRLQWRDT